jgi:Tat protein translocase TatB subunit
MFGIGGWELVVILILGLIVLGPTKLPEIAKSLGKGLASLRRSVDQVKQDIDIKGLTEEISEEVGLDELKQSVDVRSEIRKAISELEEPLDEPGIEASKTTAPDNEIPKGG